AAGKAGWTPLHLAAQCQADLIARELIAADARVNVKGGYGNTPLWRAVFNYRDDPATIRVLLEAGADPDLCNERGVIPRMLADHIANRDVARHVPPEST